MEVLSNTVEDNIKQKRAMIRKKERTPKHEY